MTSAPDRLVGSTLNETYRVLRAIGRGGMGTIYEADHERLPGKRYAIKVLHPVFAENAEAVARFRREAEIANALGHDHIVQVHDFNVQGGVAYMVMELLDGENLEERLEARGAMSVDQMLTVVEQTAAALSAAHAAHIVHRDLKPQNIFLCRRAGRDDWVKVLDFGASKVLDSRTLVTQDNVLVGTPFYMSPEQANGRVQEIDARTDVFAFGAIVWELLAGQLAFEAPTFSSALYKVSFVDPPDIHTLRPDVPPAVSLVLRRSMAKIREQRTPSVEAFQRELLDGLQGVEPADVPAPARASLPVVGGTLPRAPSAEGAPRPAHPTPHTGASGSAAPSAPASGVVAPELATHPPSASSSAVELPRRRLWVVALALAIVAAAGVGFAVLIVMPPDRAAAPVSPISPSPAARLPAPAQPADQPTAEPRPARVVPDEPDEPGGPDHVALTVRITPASARPIIRVGRKTIAKGAKGATRVPRGKPAVVSVEAPGYVSHREEVTPEADLILAVSLRRRTARRVAPAPTSPAAQARPSTRAPEPAPPAAAPAEAKPKPKPEPKPKPDAVKPAAQPPVETKKKKTGTIFDD